MSEEEYISGEEYERLQNQPKVKHSKKVSLPINQVAIAAAFLVVAIAAFYGGTLYQKHSDKNSTMMASSKFSRNGEFGQIGGGARRVAIFGQVTNITANSITVSNSRSGGSSTFSINSSTNISDNGQSIPVSSIQTGDTVMIMASVSSSTTASRILVNPSFGSFGAPSSPSSSMSGSATVN